MSRVNPDFVNEIQKFGETNVKACFNCGTCTAICSLSTPENSFPRKMIRAVDLGLEDKIVESADPWLCYYCGDCTTSCPREAEPAELMMALRRYVTSRYDWTGLSKKFYTSEIWEFGAIAFISLVVMMIFVLFHGPMTTELTAEGGVQLNVFAPAPIVEIGDWIMGGVLSFFLLSNVFIMYLKIVRNDKKLKIPFKLHFTELWSLIINFATQKRFADCGEDDKKVSLWQRFRSGEHNYWVMHFILMSSYVLMFTMIVVFLRWFQTDNIYPVWNPQRFLGYYATIGLGIGTIYFFLGRRKKDKVLNKNSHITDWTFIALLFLTTLTGILVHIFRVSGMPYTTYYTYVIHLMILVPMLTIEVPFSKWSHLAYRPFAIYFTNIKNAAVEYQKKKPKKIIKKAA